jgi:hypothetical protein
METVICFVFIVAGLVFMAKYFQRAAQGNLFGATQAVGQQFDPRDLYTETQQITTMQDTVQQQVEWGMFGGDLRRTGQISAFMRGVNPKLALAGHPDWVLESLPSGPVFREPAVQQSESDATWEVSRTATYHDER